MLKDEVKIQVLKVPDVLQLYVNLLLGEKEIWNCEMSICFEILVRIASYGPKIGQSHGENNIINIATH